MVLTSEQQRTKPSRLNDGRNALGKLVRNKAFRGCDYIPGGHLVQFDDEAGLIAFEEERRANGQRQVYYSTKVRNAVPTEQLALDEEPSTTYGSTADELRGGSTDSRIHRGR